MLTRIDPLTYIVGPMRQAVFAHLAVPPFEQRLLAPGVTWANWAVPEPVALAIVTVMGLALMSMAIIEFRKTD